MQLRSAEALADDPALVHHEDAVGQRQTSSSSMLRRARSPCRVPLGEDRRCTNSIAPTSSPRVGWPATRSSGFAPELARETTFCWLPPDRLPATSVLARRPHVVVAMRSRASPRWPCACRMPCRRSGGLVYRRGRCSRRGRTRARGPGAAGPRARATRPRRLSVARASVVMSLPLSAIGPAIGSAQADDRLDELASARCPSTPAMPTISPPRTVNDTPVHAPRVLGRRRHAGPSTSSTTSPGLDGCLVDPSTTSRPTIIRASPASSVSRGVGLPHHRPVAHHRRPGPRRHDLVELVRDDHDGKPSSTSERTTPKQLADLLRGEHRGRLVEDQESRARYSALRISTRCCMPTERSATSASGSTLKPVALGELANALRPRGGEVDDAEPRGLVAEHDVLGHRQRLDQHEVLVHHADAEVDRVRGERIATGGPVRDAAGVGLVQAVDDVHQRGLPGAVLTQQAVDLARRGRRRTRLCWQRPCRTTSQYRQFGG